MTSKQRFLTSIINKKLTICILFSITLSACTSTSQQTGNSNSHTSNRNYIALQTDIECQNHAQNIASHAESTASNAQYLAAAKALHLCISTALTTTSYNRTDEHELVIMKMMAAATLNFIKSGNVITANREIDRFKRIYPSQDLYFEDYTSFLDTATVLLSVEPMHSSQLSSLNISRVLRDEIERKYYWLNH